MRKLLRQDVKFEWTEQCESELQDLKAVLIKNPILQPRQPNKTVYAYIDASCDGYGSVTIQYDDDGKTPHVCGYQSQATTAGQKKWAIYQLEMTALALMLKTYEPLLLHLDIVCFTDNSIVHNIAKYKPINNRERRLIAYLSQFKLNIRYIPGAQNKIADCLSRLPGDLTDAECRILRPAPRDSIDDFVVSVTEANNAENEEKRERERFVDR